MIVRNRRAITATFLAGVVTAAGFLTAAPVARADPVASGTVTITGDPGDPLTGGATYSYDVAAGDLMSIDADDSRNGVGVRVDGANGDWWGIVLKAPLGQQLAVGSYPNATGSPFDEDAPFIRINNARGCEISYAGTGSFVIADVSFGPNGYVERLDATFEQHCDGGEPALRGRVVIGNPPPPPPLEVTFAAAADGVFSKLNGKATVHGTVECNRDVTVHIDGQIIQVKKVIIEGRFTTTVDCVAGETAQWSGTARPTGIGNTIPFQKGKVEVTGDAWVSDPNQGGVRVELAPTTVALTQARPVVIGDPPPPPPGEFTIAAAADGVFSKLNGKATVHGTVVCNLDAPVEIGGLIIQVKNQVIIEGRFTTTVDCVTGETAQWSGTADPTDPAGTLPFQKGEVEVTGGASTSDPNDDGQTVRAEFGPTTVTLTRARPLVEARM